MLLSNRKLRILETTLLLPVSPRTVQRYLDHGETGEFVDTRRLPPRARDIAHAYL